VKTQKRILITAGPTHEPIDQVRYIGNRSSGQLGIALADEAARRGWAVTLALGPTHRLPSDSRVRLLRFQTTAELQHVLADNFPNSDVLVMAAAVADFRPAKGTLDASGKARRTEAGLTLQLEPTPDLLAGCSKGKKASQVLIGFALEPSERLLDSARAKLDRKALDMIVANPLETMDAGTIEATVLDRRGGSRSTPGTMAKSEFSGWLMSVIEAWEIR